jgi:Fe-Mn family superoxide dismutase
MFTLSKLPYAADALAPAMSADTLNTHHGKHHAKYVETTNTLVEELGIQADSLEAVVAEARSRGAKKLFNNAAQTWNHGFFWLSLTPTAQTPGGKLAEAIERDFGGLDGLRKAFIDEGVNHFASGWVWLASRKGKLEVLSTHDGETLADRSELVPLLVCDVWEHAYYLDYKNDRKTFLDTFFDRLAAWDFAARLYETEDHWRYPAPTAKAA